MIKSQLRAYEEAAKLSHDLEEHRKGFTHIATFLDYKLQYPSPRWPNLSKIGIVFVTVLKIVHLGNASSLQEISKRIKDLKTLIQDERKSIIDDTTESYQIFFDNMSTINKLINDSNISKAFESEKQSVPISGNTQLQKAVQQIEAQRMQNVQIFTPKYLRIIENSCKKDIQSAHNALLQAYQAVKNSSSLKPQQKRETLKKLFEKYAEHAQRVHSKECNNSVSKTFMSIKRDYMNPEGLGFGPFFDKTDIATWRTAMVNPILKAAKDYRTDIDLILNKKSKSENDLKLLKDAENAFQDLNSWLIQETPESYVDIHKVLNPKGMLLTRNIRFCIP